MKRRFNAAEELLAIHLKELGLTFTREYEFAPPRRWKFDFLVEAQCAAGPWLAIEVDGGAWIQGRHTRGKGFEADMEKLNRAAILGYFVLRFSPRMVNDGTAKRVVAEWLAANTKESS